MKLKPISGRIWNVEMESEAGKRFWVAVVADTPEQALKSARFEFSGHTVFNVSQAVATYVIVPE